MKTLKMILIIILVIIAIPLIAAMFIKKNYTIKRGIVINKQTASVYNYVRYLRNQEQYNKWVMTDPNMKKQFTGIDGNEGFIYAWDSNDKKAGKGEQEIKKLVDGKLVTSEVRFEKPMKATSMLDMQLEPVTEGTKILWVMNGNNKYPMNFMNLFMDKMLGNDMQTSLINLKTILEGK